MSTVKRFRNLSGTTKAALVTAPYVGLLTAAQKVFEHKPEIADSLTGAAVTTLLGAAAIGGAARLMEAVPFIPDAAARQVMKWGIPAAAAGGIALGALGPDVIHNPAHAVAEHFASPSGATEAAIVLGGGAAIVGGTVAHDMLASQQVRPVR